MNAAVSANATPRPWTWEDGSLYADANEIVAIGSCDISLARDIALGMWDENGFAMKPEDEVFILEACNNYEHVCAERDSLNKLVDRLQAQRAEECASLSARIDTARAERDSLAKALRKLLHEASPEGMRCAFITRTTVDEARAALAKAGAP